ncbi:hypothetical protein LOD99_960 [Oopsacas minuta]|uniref:SRCR domain-containing protein n=1 Tax=Oopsacas minuta TaxID=111878 RepID=A0AAV7K1D0_9METZ|nr:hypothetical protein LOD99_960 [Oopsacas minuta]
MFVIFFLLFISFLFGCLSQSIGVTNCPSEIGFLDSSSFNPDSSHYFFYFYSGAEANGSSNRFIFPNLSVSCYVNVEKIVLFQGLPYACFDARAQYVFDLWSLDPDNPGRYELIYTEILKDTGTSVSTRINLYPNADLIMYPGDVIGFRDAALNFFSNLEPKKVTPTYWGIIQPFTSCRTFSTTELGEDVVLEGNWAPSFNFSLVPQSPTATEFQIKYDRNQIESVQTIQLYHRGIYKPICNHIWHIRTADVLCQIANFSHAVYADTELTYESSSMIKRDLSEYYWLDYLYCPMYFVEPQKCLRSSWECVSNCTTYSQTAATSCAMVSNSVDNY